MVHSLRASIILAATFLLYSGSASTAAAAPITLNFAGQFNYIDFEYLSLPRTGAGVDQFWAFDDAIRATGAATSVPGQQLLGNLRFSLTFDTSAFDLDPSPDSGLFAGAMTGKFWLGDTMYGLAPTTVSTTRGGTMNFAPASLTGPTLNAGGFSFGPPGITMLGLSGAVLANDTLDPSNFANALSWQLPLLLNFNGSAHVLASTGQVVSVSIPEASSLATLSSALLAFLAWRRRRSLTTIK